MTRRLTRHAAAALAAGLCAVSCALADPASSPQSAWSAEPLKPAVQIGDPLAARGKEVFDARCRACHGDYPKRSFTLSNNSVYALPPRPAVPALGGRA